MNDDDVTDSPSGSSDPKDGDDERGRAPEHPALQWGADLERDVPGARYGLVLVLLLVTFVFMAAGPTGDWVPLATSILQGATLLAALAAAEAHRRLVWISIFVIAVSLVTGTIVLFAQTNDTHGYASILSFLLVGAAPIAIGQAMIRRQVVDIQTVLGAISIYVFLGMFFAFLYQAVGLLSPDPFFAQQHTDTIADYLYFSFITLTTTGYGDLTAAGGLGRALAVLEALGGQIYLVTVIALLVSRLRTRRQRGTDAGE